MYYIKGKEEKAREKKKKGLELGLRGLTFLPLFFWTEMEAFFQANSLVFAPCDLALSLLLLICGMDFKLFGSECAQTVARPDSQAFCCKTGLLPSVFFFCVLSSCIVCCSICISCLCSVSCRLTKWEGLSLIHG